ncbi:hypothetical protein BSKO_07853 [Bryopsis sp. KO-2023]|nr:hypothetical protein BSKO_07853 [Bryopsis sp. KO-2023]
MPPGFSPQSMAQPSIKRGFLSAVTVQSSQADRRHQNSSSLVFDMDFSSESGSFGVPLRGLSETGSLEEFDCFRSLAMERAQELMTPASQLEKSICDVVRMLWPEQCLSEGGSPDIQLLKTQMEGMGYKVDVVGDGQPRKSQSAPSQMWKHLRHSFLVCYGVLGPAGVTLAYQKTPVVVDPRFKEQFAIAHPSPWFEGLLKVMSSEFVGHPDALKRLVSLVCDEMLKVFVEQKLSIPPWRNQKAMLSKWTGPISEYIKTRPAEQSALQVCE